jgi:glycosyltransferase involved in cell wall biosynthesis
MDASRRPRVGFVLERSLGHSTHARNLAQALAENPLIRPEFYTVPYEVTGPAAHIPLYGNNWTVRAGVRAWTGILRMQRRDHLDALFIHTQVPAVLSQRWMDRIPTVVSLDATPLQYDELGTYYSHEQGPKYVESLKYRANRSCFRRAAHVVTWSEWARRGVVSDYGVAPDKVTVVPPGVLPGLWQRTGPSEPQNDGPVRILFVGGDLRRKGGDVLLRAFASLRDERRHDPQARAVELDLVTPAPVEEADGVRVHGHVQPNSAELIELYHRAHIFCLPTRSDCLPMVLSEAGAAGLALVSTPVAAIPEIVRDGETGLLVPVGDEVALAHALKRLVDDSELRQRMSSAAERLVSAHYDAEHNARRLVSVLVDCTRPGH